MIERDNGTIRAVAWSNLFPWIVIFRAFRPAIMFRSLLLGALGVLLTATGWAMIGTAFVNDSQATEWLKRYSHCSWKAVTDDIVPNKPMFLRGDSVDSANCPLGVCPIKQSPAACRECLAVRARELNPALVLSRPACEGLAYTRMPPKAIASILLCGLWGIAVWAFFGSAICRIAAVKLAADEQVGLGAAVRFAARKWPSYFAAPLFPLGGALLFAIPIMVLGLLMHWNVGLLLTGFVWPLVLGAAFVMTLFLVGLLFGWPLMWGAISTEGTDSFDALSRSYAYTFQRPLHYFFYVVVATAFGWLGWILVKNFAAGIVWLGYWSAGWTAGSDQLSLLLGAGETHGAGRAGVFLIHFWAGCVKLLAVGYVFSYFWTASVAIYLLLRRNVDATEMDEVFLDADASEPAAPLPTIVADSQGAPVVEPAADSEDGKPADEGSV